MLTPVIIGCVAGYVVMGVIMTYSIHALTIHMYRPDNDTWRTVTNMPLHYAQCVIGGIIWPITIVCAVAWSICAVLIVGGVC